MKTPFSSDTLIINSQTTIGIKCDLLSFQLAEAIKHEADVYAREKRQLVDTFFGRECTQEVDVHVEKKKSSWRRCFREECKYEADVHVEKKSN